MIETLSITNQPIRIFQSLDESRSIIAAVNMEEAQSWYKGNTPLLKEVSADSVHAADTNEGDSAVHPLTAFTSSLSAEETPCLLAWCE